MTVDATLQSLVEAALATVLGPPSPHGQRRVELSGIKTDDEGATLVDVHCDDLSDACAQYDTSTVYEGRLRCVPGATVSGELVVVDNGTNYWMPPGRRLVVGPPSGAASP